MSSPTEPGYPRTGDGAGAGNGSTAGSPPAATGGPGPIAASGGAGPIAASGGDVPPWQRGPAARARQAPQGQEAPQGDGPRGGGSQGLDARLNRFIAGGSAPSGAQDVEPVPRGERTEAGRVDRPESPRPDQNRTEQNRTEQNRPEPQRQGPGGAYASELPDLSGPRPPQPRKAVERPAPEQPAKAAKATQGRGVQVATRQHKGPVRASMQIRRIDPWSTLKVSLLLSVVLFFVWMIAVAFLYLVLGGMGVWTKLNSNVGDLLTSASGSSGGELVSSGTIFGGAALIGLVNIVLLTAAATTGAFIYNLSTDLVGGVEVTLADRD